MPLAITEGVSVVLVMLATGLVFLGVVVVGELTHVFTTRRKSRRAERARS